jgi:glycerol-3-phosphate dehydrogenase
VGRHPGLPRAWFTAGFVTSERAISGSCVWPLGSATSWPPALRRISSGRCPSCCVRQEDDARGVRRGCSSTQRSTGLGARFPTSSPRRRLPFSCLPCVPEGLLHTPSTTRRGPTIATVTAAARCGAVVANYLRAVDLDLAPGRISRVSLEGRRGAVTVRCRAVVNASGPWLDLLRNLENSACEPITRLSKGIHVVLRPDQQWRAAAAVSLHDGQHLYAVPCEDRVLLGTTEQEYHGDPAGVAVEPGDVSYLLEKASRFLRSEILRRERVVSSFAGLRVLPRGHRATLHASRDHLLSVGPGGMVSVAGGKLTTHRHIALDALRYLPHSVRPRRLYLSDAPLPGASPAPSLEHRSHLDGSTVAHLLRMYGSETGKLLEYSKAHDNALERIAPGAPDLWTQVYHALREEWAMTAEDVIYRRTTLGLRGFDTPEIRQTISTVVEAGAQIPPPGLKEPNLGRVV